MTTTESTITLCTDALRAERAPLYHQYPGQSSPQPGIVEMDDGGVVSASYNPGSGLPMAVWHTRTLRWGVSPYVSGDVLADVLNELRPEFELLHAGHSIKWDGNNHVGRLTDDAVDARERIQDMLDAIGEDPANLAQIWAAGDYLACCPDSEYMRRYATLAEAVAGLEAEAAANDVLIHGSIADELERRIREAIHDSVGCYEYPGVGGWNDYAEHYRRVQFLGGSI
ncbi:MAG: hypothetical protein HY749_16195 [Gammaproteobacteria bacterium]|nr:hypothetical protein [Gammaproteobacteria bacterium]